MANQPLTIGVPKEIKTDEYRVAMIPAGVEELTARAHRVLIQTGAGQGSGIDDEQYQNPGAELVASAEEVWARCGPHREGEGADAWRMANDASRSNCLHLLPLCGRSRH